jgi:putative membrane protein
MTAISGTSTQDAARTDGWRRLNPRMLAVHPVQELPRAFPALLGVFAVGRGRGNGELWSLVGVGIVVGLAMLRWFTTSYRITADQVQVRRGLLRRRVLSVPRDRVRTVDVTSHALHRVLGLARVTVGTGQSDRKGDRGLRLDGLSTADAGRLHEELLHRAPVGAASPAEAPAGDAVRVGPAGTGLATLRPAWFRYAPFSLSGLVSIGVVVGFVWRAANEAHVNVFEWGPLRAYGGHLSRVPVGLAAAELVLLTLTVAALAATGGYLLAFWRFRLTRRTAGSGATLHVTRGLLTTRATTIEERRLRGAEISEPLLLRSVGGARCIAIATGLRVGRGAERGGTLLLPPAPRAEAERVAAAALRVTEPVTCALIRPDGRAHRRRYVRALVAAVVAVAAVAGATWWFGWPVWAWVVVALLAVPAAVALAEDRYRSLGHAVMYGYLVSRLGSLVRRRYVLNADGIVGWRLHRSFFQRRAGLATLVATTAAGRQRYPVPDVDAAVAVRIAHEAVPGLLEPFLV